MTDLEQHCRRAVRTEFQRWLYRRSTFVRRLTVVLAASLVAFPIATAEAGCPTHCNIEPDLVGTVSNPPLPICATIQPDASGCMCSFSLIVRNECAEPIHAVGFAFDQCSDLNGASVNYSGCSDLTKGREGRFWFPLRPEEGAGPKEQTMHVRTGEIDHTITLKANVTEFITSDTGCTLSSAPPGDRAFYHLFVVAGVLATWRLRRRARR